MLNKNQHSLALLRGIEKIIDEFESIELQYEGIIEEGEPAEKPNAGLPAEYHPHSITYVPVDKSLDFYFGLRAVSDLGKGNISYFTVWKPKSETENVQYAIAGAQDASLARFDKWATLVAGYGSVRLSKKERLISESASQFYDYFESTDEDAATKPFDNDQQVYLYKLLDFTRERVEQAEYINQEQMDAIVQEIKSLQEHIPTITKAAAVKKMSQLFAKVKALSMKLFMDTVDIAKKEVIKAALYGGLHQIEQGIHHLS